MKSEIYHMSATEMEESIQKIERMMDLIIPLSESYKIRGKSDKVYACNKIIEFCQFAAAYIRHDRIDDAYKYLNAARIIMDRDLKAVA